MFVKIDQHLQSAIITYIGDESAWQDTSTILPISISRSRSEHQHVTPPLLWVHWIRL